MINKFLNNRKNFSFLAKNILKRNHMHIKNMVTENKKDQIQKIYDNSSTVIENSRVYKPTYTIEFNRVGEVVLFSCNPIKNSTIYFKYPYILYESLIPMSLFMFVMNPLNLDWHYNYLNLIIPSAAWWPRVWYFNSFNYKIRKISLLRGGKFVKIETNSLAGDRLVNWAEITHFNPLTEDTRNFDDRDNSEFLDEFGQLKYELVCQLDHYMERGVTQQNMLLYFMKQGTVHHPELFEAVCKGIKVDTEDFVINTEQNDLANEGIDNV